MSTFGTPPPVNLASLGAAQRIATTQTERKERKKEPAKRVTSDQLDIAVDATETTDAVRSLKDNSQEEAKEDHQQNPGYTHDGKSAPPSRPRLDLNG